MTRFAIFTAMVVALPAFSGDWNPRLAADYLDSRQKDWAAWPAAKAQGGTCISCHTGMTYLWARPALRRALGENQPTPYETALLDGLRARVDVREPRASQKVGVESILAALFLGSDQAFDRMWSLQSAAGTWAWFSLKLDPWEMPESQFFGAAVAALATGSAEADYRSRPAVRESVDRMTAYLRTEEEHQPLHNRLMLLWASIKLPEALPKQMRDPILDEVWRTQQPDGGWTLEALGPWTKHAGAPAGAGTNNYATGFIAVVLEKAGVSASDKRLARALDWLRSHQDPKSGSWAAESMNKVYEPGSMESKFMRDAATSYAVIALLEGQSSGL